VFGSTGKALIIIYNANNLQKFQPFTVHTKTYKCQQLHITLVHNIKHRISL